MCAEYVPNRVARRETHHALDARTKSREVAYRQQAWVEHVARQQHARFRIVDHHMRALVAWRGNQLQLPLTQVERSNSVRPASQSEARHQRCRIRGNDSCLCTDSKLGIQIAMIAVAV